MHVNVESTWRGFVAVIRNPCGVGSGRFCTRQEWKFILPKMTGNKCTSSEHSSGRNISSSSYDENRTNTETYLCQVADLESSCTRYPDIALIHVVPHGENELKQAKGRRNINASSKEIPDDITFLAVRCTQFRKNGERPV